MSTDKIKVAVRVRPFNRRGRLCFSEFLGDSIPEIEYFEWLISHRNLLFVFCIYLLILRSSQMKHYYSDSAHYSIHFYCHIIINESAVRMAINNLLLIVYIQTICFVFQSWNWVQKVSSKWKNIKLFFNILTKWKGNT